MIYVYTGDPKLYDPDNDFDFISALRPNQYDCVKAHDLPKDATIYVFCNNSYDICHQKCSGTHIYLYPSTYNYYDILSKLHIIPFYTKDEFIDIKYE